MGELHTWSFMIGRLNLMVVYDPREWRIANDGCFPPKGEDGAGTVITFWLAFGPFELRWFAPYVAEPSWLER